MRPLVAGFTRESTHGVFVPWSHSLKTFADQRTLITLTEYVQRLGGMDRARQALETLRELKRAA